MVNEEALRIIKELDYSKYKARFNKNLIIEIQNLNNPEYNKYLAKYFIGMDSKNLAIFAGRITNETILEMDPKDNNFINILFISRFNISIVDIYHQNKDIDKAFEKAGLSVIEKKFGKYIQSKRDNSLVNSFLLGNKEDSYKLAKLVNRDSNINLILRLVPYFDKNQLDYFESEIISIEKYLIQFNNNLDYQLNKLKNTKIDTVKLILENTKFEEVLIVLSLYKNYEIAQKAIDRLNKPE